MALTDLYTNLPIGVRKAVEQTPLVAVLTIALTTYISGKWLSTSACQALRDADGKETAELRLERDLYKSIALKGVLGDEQTAKTSIAKIEQASKPSHTAVLLQPRPVTQSEKAAVEKPPQATDPATLAQRQTTAQEVLKKTAPAGATVVPAKEKP